MTPQTFAGAVAPVFWGDIDLYFQRDLGRVRDLLAALRDSGAGWVKGALIHRTDLALDDPSATVSYHVEGRGAVTEPYRDVLARHILPLDQAATIYAEAADLGLQIALSVYDDTGVAAAVDLGAAALKIPSSNIVHAPLIRRAAATGLPLALDTGRATMAEIARAVEWARSEGASELCIQHSPPAPPQPVRLHNLRFLTTLREAFGVVVGLSDHHAGSEMLFAATALGATVLEKGVITDGLDPDIDHAHALPASRLADVVAGCRAVARAMGSGHAPPTAPFDPARMGLVARRDVLPGELISTSTVDFAWPARGIPVEDVDLILGWQFVTATAARSPISWCDVRPMAP